MKIDFLGGAMEVGASCILLQVAGKNILLDAGIRQSASKDPLPNLRKIQEAGGVDAIIISHAHMDHIGALPLVSKEYPNARIYTNHMTQELMRVLLYDSIKLMERREAEIPLYAEPDVLGTLHRIIPVRYNMQMEIFEQMYITFYPAGHIAGASCLYLQTQEGTIFYSGDFSTFSQRTIEGAKIPKLRPDVAIVESTYGDRLHSNRQVEEKQLIQVVEECIEKQGKMVIPVFALGRAQEVILILKAAMNKKEIPGVPVYVDGMVRDINTVFHRNPLYLKGGLGKKIQKGYEPFYDEYIKAVPVNADRSQLVNQKGCAIFVSSSGMLTGGPSAVYAGLIGPREDGYIVITGYQDEEAPGRQIINLLDDTAEERVLKLRETTVPLKCTMKKIGLSAHGDKNEIKGLLERLTPRNVFLVHGNDEVIQNLGKELVPLVRGRVYTPETVDTYEVDIHNPRKQLKKQFSHSMQRKEPFQESDSKALWEYVFEHYPGKYLTIHELAFIWSGKHDTEEETLIKMQQALYTEVWFETDPRRLYMLKARLWVDIEQDLKPKEITMQELEEIAVECFNGVPYNKIGYYLPQKEIRLNTDFPDAVDAKAEIEEFQNRTGFAVTLSSNMNTNAAQEFLTELLGSDIKKVSFFSQDKQVNVELYQNEQLEEQKAEVCRKEFAKKTGWQLLFSHLSENISKSVVMVEGSEQKMEQNEALYYVDQIFYGADHKLYRKSIKSDNRGQYLELGFISPTVGAGYQAELVEIAKITGWRVSISQSVNLNEIIKCVNVICKREQIVLRKNPSFQPADNRVGLKVAQEDKAAAVPEHVLKEIEYQTGCLVVVI